jgi:hypothetical protein
MYWIRSPCQVLGEQLGVARLHAAVAAHVQVPALFGGDDADVLALRLGAFARAAGDAELDLVRRAQALVAVLERDRQARPSPARRSGTRSSRRRTSPCAAPCRRRGRIRSRRRSAPPRSAAAARRGRRTCRPAAPPVILVYRPYFLATCRARSAVGRDLAARHARHDRVGAVLLDVGEKVVVGVLQAAVPASARSRSSTTRGCWRRRACRCRSPGPCRAGQQSSKVRISPTRTRWYSSWRE